MKTAIVGVGRWGKNLLKELNEQSEVIWACHGGSSESVRHLTENYPDIKQTDLLKNVLTDKNIESVFVATPSNTHYEIAKQILESGKNLFLEKPGTTSSEDLEQLVHLAKEKELKLAIGYEFPHHPVMDKLQELIAGKPINKLRFEWQKWGSFHDDAVTNLLCHEVSIMKAWHLPVKSLTCHKTQVISTSDILETTFKAGTVDISSTINRASTIKQKTVMLFLENQTYIWSNNQLFEINSDELREIVVSNVSSVANEIADYLDAVKNNREPKINGMFGLEVYRTIEEVRNIC